VRAHTGLTGTGLSAVLLAYGAAGVAGVGAVAAIADRRPRTAMFSCCGAVVLALALIALVGHSTPAMVIATLAWGAGFTALPICLQNAVLRVAPQMPDTASALYVVAFQIGIGGGALIGAGLLGSGALGSIPVVALALVAIGSAIAAVSGQTFARDPDAPSGPRTPAGRWRHRSDQFCSPRAIARQASQRGHGGFQG
jgi:predicted MFS family arabinose efflux permease